MSIKLKAGELVEVRSAEDILATLDENGCLDGLPFMREMMPFIGGQYRVSKRAHKTCDTVHRTGGRRLDNCVHLEDQRCDGSHHDKCKATCLLFWKTDWLRRVQPSAPQKTEPEAGSGNETAALETLAQESSKYTDTESGDTIYRCQATALYDASQPLAWYDMRQYAEDLSSGNTKVLQMLRVWFFHGLHKLMGLGVAHSLWTRIYDALQQRVGGYRNPFRSGSIPVGHETPELTLNLQPGEKVLIRPQDEILATLNSANKNRGMRFDKEMVPYCGKVYKVRRRVDRIIHETTGRMIEIKTPSVILDGVVCKSEMSQCRLFCPRAIPAYWREIWLERLDKSDDSPTRGQSPPT